MNTRILIVEDEVLIANDLARTLEGMDYAVSAIAYDGNAALKEIATNAPDLVLLDINLGSQPDGIRIAEELQKTHQIPFIFLTSYATEMILDKAKKTQPVGYVVNLLPKKIC
jgi:CheY-like chemotaxis protein